MNQHPFIQTLRRRHAARRLQAQHQAGAGSRLGRIQRARHQLGLTILELLIVLAILGLIMGLVIGPRLTEMFGEGQSQVAQAEVKKLVFEAYTRWQMKNPGKNCSDLQINDLAKLLDKKEAKDPWGFEYIMFCGDNAPPGSKGFAIQSKGPDGKQDTDDDIKSWEL